jgi:hypothetical protein
MCVSMCDKACESDNNFMFLINIKIYIFERRMIFLHVALSIVKYSLLYYPKMAKKIGKYRPKS